MIVRFSAGRLPAPTALVNHFAAGSGGGLRLVVAVDGDACLVEQGRPVAGHARPFKTRIELSPLLGGQGVDEPAEPGTGDRATAHAAGLAAGVHGGPGGRVRGRVRVLPSGPASVRGGR